MVNRQLLERDVIIIGGGATGAGIARDCLMRGLSCVLLERHDISTGSTGRNHGLLHSGARYAVNDPESALECIQENRILKSIASHCIEECDGLFISLPEDGLDYQTQLLSACAKVGIETELLTPAQALAFEPSVNPKLISAVRVPDGTIDPFRLTSANMLAATKLGGSILTYHEVTGITCDQDRATGVTVYDHREKIYKQFAGKIIVNAAGIWGQQLLALANINLRMFPSKGSLLILEHRLNRHVINRCRKPADADILVPGDTISLIGTTSVHIPYNEIDDLNVTPQEVELILHEGAKLAPKLATSRILRAYAGVRPLVAADQNADGRNVSRGIVLLDHAKRDGIEGLITITGGKLATYRMMAEYATDLICRKLNISQPCQTEQVALPGSGHSTQQTLQKIISLPNTLRYSSLSRHGDEVSQFDANSATGNSLVCECEMVSVNEMAYAIKHLQINNLIDLRRRTRVGMGSCQGEVCSCRAASLLHHFKLTTPQQSIEQLQEFLNERWKGVQPILWKNALRESELTNWIYQGLCGLSAPEKNPTEE